MTAVGNTYLYIYVSRKGRRTAKIRITALKAGKAGSRNDTPRKTPRIMKLLAIRKMSPGMVSYLKSTKRKAKVLKLISQKC